MLKKSFFFFLPFSLFMMSEASSYQGMRSTTEILSGQRTSIIASDYAKERAMTYITLGNEKLSHHDYFEALDYFHKASCYVDQKNSLALSFLAVLGQLAACNHLDMKEEGQRLFGSFLSDSQGVEQDNVLSREYEFFLQEATKLVKGLAFEELASSKQLHQVCASINPSEIKTCKAVLRTLKKRKLFRKMKKENKRKEHSWERVE